mgnify:CR=1 FL=1
MTAWVEVDLAALRHNLGQVRSIIGPATLLCAVVKGNAYGHGAVSAAQAFVAAGADWLGVTTGDEAVELREAGLRVPILLLASHAPDEAEAVAELGLVPFVSAAEAAQTLAAAARALDATQDVHLLLDCGMGRDGAPPETVSQLAEQVRRDPNLRLAGLATHFPQATSPNRAITLAQFRRFEGLANLVGADVLRHCANSAACLDLPETRLDMVRVGTLLYGQYPAPHLAGPLELRPTWRLKARLVEVRRLRAGSTIGYGSEVKLARETRVGTMLLGWQQGLTLEPASVWRGARGLRRWLRREQPSVTVNGHRCPLLGRVSMQSCAIDLTNAPEAVVGSEVEVSARRVTVDRALPRILRDE